MLWLTAYKNDNSGFGSPNTGFFIGFKQGTLNFQDFQIDNGLPNMAIDINADNVANGEVWVQTIDEVGQIQKSWTRVDRLFGANTLFNARQNKIRDIQHPVEKMIKLVLFLVMVDLVIFQRHPLEFGIELTAEHTV